MKPSYEEYRFDREVLGISRPKGISAIMRIKNGQDFLRLTIESHLPYFDEIIACYNDCSDSTPEILNDLAARYPGKVRVYPYEPKVHPILSPEHERTPTESVHSLANYYNYALSKARYCLATKLDDDHLANDKALLPVIEKIRREIGKDRHRKVYTFSGINLSLNSEGRLGVLASDPFVGTGDHMFFPVCKEIYFRQAPRTEHLHFESRQTEKEYTGILYFHLKHLKQDSGFGNLNDSEKEKALEKFRNESHWLSFDDFRSPSNLDELRRSVPSLEYWLRTNGFINRMIHALTRRNPPLRIARLNQLESDLARVNFSEDVLERITQAEFSRTA